jgi:hypothetical protein
VAEGSKQSEARVAPDDRTGKLPSERTAVIAPELAAVAQNGAAISIASCTRDGHPIVGFGVGCSISSDGTVRVLLSRASNARLLEAILAGGAVAVTFTSARDHTSFQVKASRAVHSESCPDDRPEIERQATLLREGLVELGFSPDQATGYTAYDLDQLGSIVLRPERVFSQTPGPGAGTEIKS